MTKDELNNDYFRWMCRLVSGETYSKRLSYRKLLHRLHDTPFVYTIAMDGNRAEDGIDLRYRFGYEREFDGPMIATFLDDRDCSVLEMLIALAIRCEEHIMDDPDIGNRTGQWFWGMTQNLGLEYMDDTAFDDKYVDYVILKFLNREYGRNGVGGLFTVDHSDTDLRAVEIWYQMCWYLDNILQV
jgi:hypothetical protein